jgi:hypothetical protein
MPTPPSQKLPFPYMQIVAPSAPCRRTRLTKDGVDIIPVGYAWLDKEKPCGERSAALRLSKRRTILPPVPAPQMQAGQDLKSVRSRADDEQPQ